MCILHTALVGAGEEWSGGGDTGEWQGGGEVPPLMSRWNDPKESGDGRKPDVERDNKDARWLQQGRWNTDGREQSWNREQGRDPQNGSSKDVDYRQQDDQSAKAPEEQHMWATQEQRAQRGEEEKYATLGWNQSSGGQSMWGQEEQQKHKETYSDYDYGQTRSDQYKTSMTSLFLNVESDQFLSLSFEFILSRLKFLNLTSGDWKQPGNDAEKSGWQGGGNEDKDNRYSNKCFKVNFNLNMTKIAA